MRALDASLRRRIPALILAVLVVLLLGQGAVPLRADEEATPLPPHHERWLEEVALLITEEEKEAFLALREDYQRDAFIERFWRLRESRPTGRGDAFREQWEGRVAQARARFGNLTEDRAKYFLLAGPPDASLEVSCQQVLWPLEIWYYAGTEQVRGEFALVFVRTFGGARYHLWYPSDGLEALAVRLDFQQGPRQLFAQIERYCRQRDEILQTLAFLLGRGPLEFEEILARLQRLPLPGEETWASDFAHYVTDIPAGAELLPGSFEVDYPGRHQLRTVVKALVGVATEEAGVDQVGDHRAYNFRLVGDVLREGRLLESFRYRFDLPAEEVTTDTIPLLFYRYLRPGKYRLIVRVEDVNSGRFFRVEEDLEVPEVRQAWMELEDPESARLFAEVARLLESGEDAQVLSLLPPPGGLLAGPVRFDTQVASNDISHVTFALDEQHVLTKRSPPFSVELDLGRVPKTRTLVATAYDAAGEVLGRDQLLLNPGGHRFSVHLVEPRSGQQVQGRIEARADVRTPPQENLHRVEFYLNDELAGTSYSEPFTRQIEVLNGDLSFIRAVAYLTDGNSTEDIVFINTPDYFEHLNIQFVELYASVLDRRGRPMAGLGKDDFRVEEDGVEQQIVRFEKVDDLPVHTAVVLDVSGSMEGRLEEARQAALHYFTQGVTPRDRAGLVTFNHHPRLEVELTNQLDQLSAGLTGLRAEGGTALWDSVIFSLYYLQGIKGQRAVLLLSDGDDVSSRFEFDDAMEFARRTGVSIYTVGLALGRGERQARRLLTRLADETGGRSFFVDTAGELVSVYDSVLKELRSRYLIAYQSSNVEDTRGFRAVHVEVRRPGLEAKTIRGYYP